MTISDALPIQFWYNGIPTYNEYDPGQPFDHILFYPEFLSTDDQIVQLRDTTGLTYNLQFLDCDGVETNLLPFTEIATGVYQITFNPGDLGIVNTKRQLKIQKGTIIGSITTETQVSIDEFISDLDGWTNVVKPVASLQDLADFQQTDNAIPPGGLGTNWILSSGKPVFVSAGGGANSKWAYIELNGLNAFSYSIHTEIDVTSTFGTGPILYFDVAFYFLDSSLNVLDGTGYGESAGTPPETKSFDFIVPSGIGDVKYIALKIIDYTSITGQDFKWNVATLITPSVATWAWSSDDSGCAKITTVNTTDTAIIMKSETLPQQNHYIRIKWQTTYPHNTTNLTIFFKILDSSNTILFAQVFASPGDTSEQTFNQFINASIYLTASKLSIESYDPSGNFIAGDIIRLNSVEVYTSVTEYVTSFTEMAKSDYLLFSNILENCIYIFYKSLKNFAGIYYNSSSPYFTIRIPSIFQKQKPITEQKAIDLSNSVVINTASQLKIQKMLKTEDLPDYMHTKIILILQHAISGSVIINNVEWTNEEGYVIEEPNEFYILNRGSIQLTRKNYVERNVI